MTSRFNYTDDQLNDIVWDDDSDWEVVYEDGWHSDGKYELTYVIVKLVGTDKTYLISGSRTGSYHTDYYTTFEQPVEVVKTVKMVEQVDWVTVQ